MENKKVTVKKGFGIKCGAWMQDFYRSDGSISGTIEEIVSTYDDGLAYEVKIKLDSPLFNYDYAVVQTEYLEA